MIKGGIFYMRQQEYGERGRKKERLFFHLSASFLVAGLLVTSLTGCQNSIQTEEQIVTPKEGTQAQETDAVAMGTLTEQLQMPKRYQSSFSGNTVSVTADADIVVPNVEGIRTKRVRFRAFTQEDYDRVISVVPGEGQLWQRDMEAMEASHGFTKSELDERIAEVEAQKAAWGGHGDWEYEGMGITVDERLAQLKEQREAAPQEPVIREIPGEVKYVESSEYSEENMLMGYITVDSTDYAIDVDNMIYEGFCRPCFHVQKEEDNGKYFSYNRIDNEEELAGLEGLEDAQRFREDAQALADRLGLAEFAVRGWDPYVSYRNEDETIVADRVAYAAHLTRTIDGIPVTYDHEYGSGNEPYWPEEELNLFYNADGLLAFEWISPYEIEELSENYVFLLPFSEIQQIFEEMILKRYEDTFQEAGMTMDIRVEEVRLGYMRVRNKENLMEATLVPVWDFYGTKTSSGGSFTEPYTKDDPHASLLTIHAMDGTVLDRGAGF